MSKAKATTARARKPTGNAHESASPELLEPTAAKTGARAATTLNLLAGYKAAQDAIAAVSRARSAEPLIDVFDRYAVTATGRSKLSAGSSLARKIATMSQFDLSREPFMVLGAAGEAARELASRLVWTAKYDAFEALVSELRAIPAAP